MQKEFAYKKFKSTELWNVINHAIGDLVENTDIEETASREYIVGYLCKTLFDSELVKLEAKKDN